MADSTFVTFTVIHITVKIKLTKLILSNSSFSDLEKTWRVQNIVVISRVYLKLERSEFSSNFEFDRNMLSGTGAKSYIRSLDSSQISLFLLVGTNNSTDLNLNVRNFWHHLVASVKYNFKISNPFCICTVEITTNFENDRKTIKINILTRTPSNLLQWDILSYIDFTPSLTIAGFLFKGQQQVMRIALLGNNCALLSEVHRIPPPITTACRNSGEYHIRCEKLYRKYINGIHVVWLFTTWIVSLVRPFPRHYV